MGLGLGSVLVNLLLPELIRYLYVTRYYHLLKGAMQLTSASLVHICFLSRTVQSFTLTSLFDVLLELEDRLTSRV